jgi:hypothetical protein
LKDGFKKKTSGARQAPSLYTAVPSFFSLRLWAIVTHSIGVDEWGADMADAVVKADGMMKEE